MYVSCNSGIKSFAVINLTHLNTICLTSELADVFVLPLISIKPSVAALVVRFKICKQMYFNLCWFYIHVEVSIAVLQNGFCPFMDHSNATVNRKDIVSEFKSRLEHYKSIFFSNCKKLVVTLN